MVNDKKVQLWRKQFNGYTNLIATGWKHVKQMVETFISKEFVGEDGTEKFAVEEAVKKILKNRSKGNKSYHNRKSNNSNQIVYPNRNHKGQFLGQQLGAEDE